MFYSFCKVVNCLELITSMNRDTFFYFRVSSNCGFSYSKRSFTFAYPIACFIPEFNANDQIRVMWRDTLKRLK